MNTHTDTTNPHFVIGYCEQSIRYAVRALEQNDTADALSVLRAALKVAKNAQ